MHNELIIILNSGSSTPGWVTPVLAGGFTLLGVLIANFFNWLSDKRKTKREDQYRWDDEIRSEASQLMASCEDALRSLEKLHSSQVSGEDRVSFKSDHLQHSKAANKHLYALWVIAPEAVNGPANGLFAHVMSVAVNGTGAVTSTMSEHRRRCRLLINAVRQEVGVRDSVSKQFNKQNESTATHTR